MMAVRLKPHCGPRSTPIMANLNPNSRSTSATNTENSSPFPGSAHISWLTSTTFFVTRARTWSTTKKGVICSAPSLVLISASSPRLMCALFDPRQPEPLLAVEPVPVQFPKIEGAEIAANTYGARLAGDFYDSLRVGPERILFGLL